MQFTTRHKNTIGIITLFILYTLYLWLWINPILYLIRGYREFFTGTYFLQDFLTFPGNPAEYVSRFITQLYNYPLPASVLIAAILYSIYSSLLNIFKSEKNSCWIAFIPVFVLMLMHNDYRHTIRFDLDILTVCLVLNLQISTYRYRSRFSYISFPFLLALLLYLNGIFASLTFVCLACIISLLRKEDKTHFAGYLLWTPIIYLLFHYLFHLSIHDFYQEYTDISRIYTFPYYPFILYLSVLLTPILIHLTQSVNEKTGKKIKPTYMIPVAFALVFSILFLTSGREEKTGLYVQYHALNGNWEKALTYAAGCEYPDKDIVIYTNQALYHTGRIYDDLFRYNQSLGSEGLLSTEIKNYSGIVPNQDVLLHLGAISLSIIWGTEATNVYGANPYVLKNLVKAYLAGGYIIEAKKILNQLNQTPFQKKWAEEYKQYINDTTLINRNKELNTYRQSQAPLAVVSTQNTLMNLYLLMKDSKQNRMAYDYLLVASLLDHKIDYFASYLTGLKEYGHTTIPKLYFEGLVYNSLYSPQSPVNIREYTFNPDIIHRFDTFRKDLRAALRDPESASVVLEDKYKDTYWYYLLFRSSLPNEEKINILNRMTT